MGAVQIDIYKQDRKYYNTSFSSESDVYDILWALDEIYNDAHSGNHEAIVLLADFQEYLKHINNDVLNEYYTIQCGIKPLTLEDYEKDIIDVISERLRISKVVCEENLYSAIKDMIKNNFEMWQYCCKKNFKNKYIKTYKIKNCFDESNITDVGYLQKDFIKKYVLYKHIYRQDVMPNDLQDLIDFENEISKKINALKLKNNKTNKEKNELNKLIKLDIQVWEDINILKDHYKILRKSTQVEYNNLSYDEQMYYRKYTEDQVEPCEENINNEYSVGWQVEKIKHIAEQILTEKQLIIFNLYYICGLTQQEIAEIVDVSQQFITKQIKKIIYKIKKGL